MFALQVWRNYAKRRKHFGFVLIVKKFLSLTSVKIFSKKLKKLSQKQWTKLSFRHSAKFLTFFFNTSPVTMNEFDVGTRTLKLKPKIRRVSLDDHKKKSVGKSCYKTRHRAKDYLPSAVIRLIRSCRSCDRMHSSSCGRLKSRASYTAMPTLRRIWNVKRETILRKDFFINFQVFSAISFN